MSQPRPGLQHTAECSFVFSALSNSTLVQKHSDFSQNTQTFSHEPLQWRGCTQNVNVNATIASQIQIHAQCTANTIDSTQICDTVLLKNRFPAGRSHHHAHLIRRKSVSNLKCVCFNSGLICWKLFAVLICRNIAAAPRKDDRYSCVWAGEALTGADATPLKIWTPTHSSHKDTRPAPTFADDTTLFLSGRAISFSWPCNLAGCGDKWRVRNTLKTVFVYVCVRLLELIHRPIFNQTPS